MAKTVCNNIYTDNFLRNCNNDINIYNIKNVNSINNNNGDNINNNNNNNECPNRRALRF